MNEQETQEYYLSCICNTSADYARRYIPKATLETLRKCHEILRRRSHTKTLRGMIEARIRRLERNDDKEVTNA